MRGHHGNQALEHAIAGCDSEQSSRKREQEAFRQKLREDRCSRTTQCAADRNLLPPRSAIG